MENEKARSENSALNDLQIKKIIFFFVRINQKMGRGREVRFKKPKLGTIKNKK